MSIDDLLTRYTAKNDGEDGSVESHECYGVIRPQRERALMLELRKKDGTIIALPYAMIEMVQFTPRDEIKLLAGGREIRITGSNLNCEAMPKIGVLRGLVRHRVAWIEEASGANFRSERSTDLPNVETIAW